MKSRTGGRSTCTTRTGKKCPTLIPSSADVPPPKKKWLRFSKGLLDKSIDKVNRGVSPIEPHEKKKSARHIRVSAPCAPYMKLATPTQFVHKRKKEKKQDTRQYVTYAFATATISSTMKYCLFYSSTICAFFIAPLYATVLFYVYLHPKGTDASTRRGRSQRRNHCLGVPLEMATTATARASLISQQGMVPSFQVLQNKNQGAPLYCCRSILEKSAHFFLFPPYHDKKKRVFLSSHKKRNDRSE